MSRREATSRTTTTRARTAKKTTTRRSLEAVKRNVKNNENGPMNLTNIS